MPLKLLLNIFQDSSFFQSKVFIFHMQIQDQLRATERHSSLARKCQRSDESLYR